MGKQLSEDSIFVLKLKVSKKNAYLLNKPLRDSNNFYFKFDIKFNHFAQSGCEIIQKLIPQK